MYYVICPYDKVREQFPTFNTVMAELQTKLISHADNKWSEKYGGVNPKSGQYGKSTIMPELFNGLCTNFQPLTTWRQVLNAVGSQIIMRGSNSGAVYKDYIVGLCGLAFLDKAQRITEIKMQIGDSKIGRINLEEAQVYENPCIIFEDSWIIDEQNGFDLYAYVKCRGETRIKPIGMELNKVPNKLQASNCGAALL